MEQHGTLVAIARRGHSRGAMEELGLTEITLDQGILGDFRGQPGGRQITVLALADWQAACTELGVELPWTMRRANLLVDGLRLRATTDAVLRLGDVVLQITGETEPCSRMDEAAAGLCRALTPDWRGGVCCRVLEGGTVSPQIEVVLKSDAEPPNR